MEVMDFGPRGLLDESSNEFVLQINDWRVLQQYTGDGIKAPVNEAEMRNLLMLDDQSIEMPPVFNELYPVYSKVHDHCYAWQSITYPSVIKAANRIFDYAQNASEYYTALEPLIKKIKTGDKDAIEDFREACSDLAESAQTYASEAKELGVSIQQFTKNSGTDKDALTGLKAKLIDACGANSAEVKRVQDEITQLKTDLKKFEDKLNLENEIVDYLYIIPWIGFIADKLKDAIDGTALQAKINEIKGEIENDEAELKRDKAVNAYLSNVESQHTKLSSELNAAYPVIQKIHGTWDALSSDLQAIATYDDTTLQEKAEKGFLDEMHLNTAASKWDDVMKKADNFRVYADVSTI